MRRSHRPQNGEDDVGRANGALHGLPPLWGARYPGLRQRRLHEYRFSLAQTPAELEQQHRAFIQTYNTTAYQGLPHDQRLPPMPIEVLGTAKGRMYAPEELARHFSQALFPRTTNRYGCVTLHSYHFYIEAGLPHCGRERVSLLVDFSCTRTLSARGQLNVL
jgi:hypothetical protein